MSAYQWRYEILLEAVEKIARTGNETAKAALLRVETRKHRKLHERENELLKLISGEPMEIIDIAAAMGMTRARVDTLLLALRKNKKAYLHSFRRIEGNERGLRYLWAAGDKPDAVYQRPERTNKQPQTIRAYAPVKRDALVSALFG